MSGWFVSTLKYGGLVLAIVPTVALVYTVAVASGGSDISKDFSTAIYSVFLVVGVACVFAAATWERKYPSDTYPL